jgi:hypothetical protein
MVVELKHFENGWSSTNSPSPEKNEKEAFRFLRTVDKWIFVFICISSKKIGRKSSIVCHIFVRLCPRVARWYIFKRKNSNFGKFRIVLQGKMLVNFTIIWYISMSFGIFDGHLVYFVAILVYFSRFGMLCQEKSGNPALAGSAIPRIRVSSRMKNDPSISAAYCLITGCRLDFLSNYIHTYVHIHPPFKP